MMDISRQLAPSLETSGIGSPGGWSTSLGMYRHSVRPYFWYQEYRRGIKVHLWGVISRNGPKPGVKDHVKVTGNLVGQEVENQRNTETVRGTVYYIHESTRAFSFLSTKKWENMSCDYTAQAGFSLCLLEAFGFIHKQHAIKTARSHSSDLCWNTYALGTCVAFGLCLCFVAQHESIDHGWWTAYRKCKVKARYAGWLVAIEDC